MARPALTDEQKRAIRQQIRKATAEIYAESGLEKISARAVAERAGVSVGTIYAHFNSLSELMQSLWRGPARRMIDDMQEIARKINPPRERLEALLTAYVQFAQDNESVFRGAYLYVRPENQPAPDQARLTDDRFFQLFAATLKQGQHEGVFRSGEVDEQVQMILSAVHGSLALPVNLHRLALDASMHIPKQMITAMIEWLSTE